MPVPHLSIFRFLRSEKSMIVSDCNCVCHQSGVPPFLKLERFSSGRRGNIDDTCSMCDDDDGTGRKA